MSENKTLYDEIRSLAGLDNNLSLIEKSDNFILNAKGSGPKIMFSLVAQEKNILIKKVEKNKAEFEAVWERDKSILTNKVVYKNNEPIGVIRSENEKEFVEIFTSKEIKSGDFLEFSNGSICKDNILYTYNSEQEIVRNIAKKISNTSFGAVNDLYFTVSKHSHGALSVANTIMPDFIFAVYQSPCNENFVIGNGCGIMLKDGNAVSEPMIYNSMCDISLNKSIKTQTFIGRKNLLAEQFGIIGTGARVGGICIPCSGCGSLVEVVNLEDIKNAADLIMAIAETNINTEAKL